MNPVITEENEDGEWVVSDDADESVLDDIAEQMPKQEEPSAPVARKKDDPRAGKWRTTEDGGKIFIDDDGDMNFGGPNGPPAKEDESKTSTKSPKKTAPAKPTHSVKLPLKKTKLTISTSNTAMEQMGFKVGRGNFDFKKKKTSYEVTNPDGTKQWMSSDEIKKLVYEGKS